MEWSLLKPSPWLPWLLLATCVSVTLARDYQDMSLACLPAEYHQTTAPLNSSNRVFVEMRSLYYTYTTDNPGYPKTTGWIFLDENQRKNTSYRGGHIFREHVIYFWYDGKTVKAFIASVFQNTSCVGRNDDAELEWGCLTMDLEHEGDTAVGIYTHKLGCRSFGNKMELRWMSTDWVRDSPDLACFNNQFPGIAESVQSDDPTDGPTDDPTDDLYQSDNASDNAPDNAPYDQYQYNQTSPSKRFVTLNITQAIHYQNITNSTNPSIQKESTFFNLTEGKLTYLRLNTTDYTSSGFKHSPRNLTILYRGGEVYIGIGHLTNVLYTNVTQRVSDWDCNFKRNVTLDVSNTSARKVWGRRFYLYEVRHDTDRSVFFTHFDVTSTHEEWVYVQLPQLEETGSSGGVEVFGSLVLLMTSLSYMILQM